MGMSRGLVIAIDFDGTCVTHDFPRVGEEIGAPPVLKALVNSGHQLILFTMRSDVESPVSEDEEIHAEPGRYLSDAVDWFKRHDIPLYGINTNPTQSSWTSSPKAYANMYIDDLALGVPLKADSNISDGPFVDWAAVRRMLENAGIITYEKTI
jgi:hypothetical protein